MRWLLTALLLLVAGVPGAGAGAETTLTFPERPELFVSFEPSSGRVRVQQQVVMRIRLVSARPFEALSITRPEGDGRAEILELSAPRTREVRSYAANGFVHEASYAIFPLRSGPLPAPSIRAVGRVSGPGGGAPFDLSAPGPTLDILPAPEGWTEPWWMIADAVEIDESWSIPPERLRKGDVVRRTVTLSARGAPAERMAPPVHGAARGVDIHEAGSSSRTLRSADGFTGVIEKSWDIVIGDATVVNIPPVRVVYWDTTTDARSLRAARALRIEPAEPDREARAAALMSIAKEERQGAARATALLALLVAVPALALIATFALAALPSGADLRLRSACRRTAEPEAALRAVETWRRETGLAASECAPVRRLEAALFGGGGQSDARAAAAALLSISRRTRRAALICQLKAAADRALGPAQTLGLRRDVSFRTSLRNRSDSR